MGWSAKLQTPDSRLRTPLHHRIRQPLAVEHGYAVFSQSDSSIREPTHDPGVDDVLLGQNAGGQCIGIIVWLGSNLNAPGVVILDIQRP